MMTNLDPEGQIFLSYPHMNNGFFFLLTTLFILKYAYRGPGDANTQFHLMTLLDVLGKIVWVR